MKSGYILAQRMTVPLSCADFFVIVAYTQNINIISLGICLILFHRMLFYMGRENCREFVPSELWSLRRSNHEASRCLYPGGQLMGTMPGNFKKGS